MSNELEMHRLRRIIDVLRAALIDISTDLGYLNKEAPNWVAEETETMERLADKALSFDPYADTANTEIVNEFTNTLGLIDGVNLVLKQLEQVNEKECSINAWSKVCNAIQLIENT